MSDLERAMAFLQVAQDSLLRRLGGDLDGVALVLVQRTRSADHMPVCVMADITAEQLAWACGRGLRQIVTHTAPAELDAALEGFVRALREGRPRVRPGHAPAPARGAGRAGRHRPPGRPAPAGGQNGARGWRRLRH